MAIDEPFRLLQSSSDPGIGLLLFLGLFVVAGLAIAATGVAHLRTWVLLKRGSAVSPGDASTGPVQVEGTAAVADRNLVAPFTETECLAFELEVEKYRHDDDGSNWKTKVREDHAVPFLVSDHTGRVAVDPDGADTSLATEFRTVVDRDETPPDRVQRFLDQQGMEHESGSFDLGPLSLSTGDKHRFTERRLDVDESVYVSGEAVMDRSIDGITPVVEGTPHDSVRDRFRGVPFLVADTDEGAAERRQLKKALGRLVFGAIFAGIPLFFLVFTG
jgi:hypothetical protein